MNMRKIIAVLAAALMLCSIIPMGAISVSAADNLVGNGSFESGTNGWGKSTNTVLTTEDGALKATHADDWAYVYTSVSLTPNTDYVVTFRAKADKGGFKINFNNTSWGSVAASVPSLVPAITTEWKDYELYFNSASYNKLLVFFQSDQTGANAQTIWLDDVSISVADSASFGTSDGYIYNGNFETGASAPWAMGNNASIVADPTGSNRGYVMKADEAGSGKTMFAQPAINLKANTDYVLSFKMYNYNTATNNAFWVQFPKAVTNWSVDLSAASGMNSTSANDYTPRINVLGNTGAWYDLSITFNTGDLNAVYINFMNYRSGAGQYYFDDIKIVEKKIIDTFVTNGDFETGDLTGWKNSYNGVVQSDVVHSGNYAHKTTNTASKYQGMMQQNPIAVKANSDYTVTFWYYYEGNNATGSGASFYLYAQTTDNSTNIKSITSYPAAANTWYQVTHTFNTGSNTEIALVWSNRMVSDGGTYYFDDVVMSGPAPEVEPSFDGYITNGDFETGDLTGWTVTAANIVEEGNGFYLQGTNTAKYKNFVHQIVTVKPNTEYAISFKAKAAASGGQARLYAGTGIGNTGNKNKNYYWSPKTDAWTTYTTSFNSGDATELYINLCQGVNNGGDIYYDDILMWELKDPSYDGYLYNGDFETGISGNWKLSQSTNINTAAAKDGTFGAQLIGSGWGGLLGYTFAVENGATYQLTYDAKANTAGFNSAVLVDTWEGAKLATQTVNATEWATYTLEFTAASNQCYFNLNGYSSSASVDCYVDNVKVVKIKDAHTCEFVGTETKAPTCGEAGEMTYSCTCGEGTYTEEIPATGEHTYGNDYDANCNVCGAVREVALPIVAAGTSVSEDVDGVATRFDISVSDMAVINGTTAVYTNATVDGYKLIEMGAIAANDKSSVKIPAVYLWDLEADSAAFAVRIINIPEDKQDVEITFTPYFVLEIDGVETTIYGEPVIASYATVLG